MFFNKCKPIVKRQQYRMAAYWPTNSLEQEVSIFSSIIFRSSKVGSLPRKLVFWGRMGKETRNQSWQKNNETLKRRNKESEKYTLMKKMKRLRENDRIKWKCRVIQPKVNHLKKMLIMNDG